MVLFGLGHYRSARLYAQRECSARRRRWWRKVEAPSALAAEQEEEERTPGPGYTVYILVRHEKWKKNSMPSWGGKWVVYYCMYLVCVHANGLRNPPHTRPKSFCACACFFSRNSVQWWKLSSTTSSTVYRQPPIRDCVTENACGEKRLLAWNHGGDIRNFGHSRCAPQRAPRRYASHLREWWVVACLRARGGFYVILVASHRLPCDHGCPPLAPPAKCALWHWLVRSICIYTYIAHMYSEWLSQSFRSSLPPPGLVYACMKC